MGKKITLTVLLLLVLAGTLLQYSYIKSATEKLTRKLDAVQSALASDDASSAIDAADAFCTTWEKEKNLYQMLFEHDEVDVISATAKSIDSYCRSEDTAHALAEIATIRYYIEHIKEIDSLSWENIF
jgi:hypothetical protein